jgi:DNA-binding beta-propeller fold protein YncE
MKRCNSPHIFRKGFLVVAELALGCKMAFATTSSLDVFTIPIGNSQSSNVNSVIFDGQYIWAAVQNSNGGALEKISKSGTVISVTRVGSAPIEMAFDGANIWVTEYTSNDVRIINENGAIVGNILLPSAHPEGILFDGKYIWVANNGAGMNSISKFDAAAKSLINTYIVGLNPAGVAFDGTNIWVTNSYNGNVWKINRNTGERLGSYTTGIFPQSIVFDGKNMWVGNGSGVNLGSGVADFGSVSKIRAADGAALGTFIVGNRVRGLAYDGTSIWICNSSDNTVTRLRASGVALVGTYRTGKSPRAVAYDGSKIWVANSGDNTLTVIAPHTVSSSNGAGAAGTDSIDAVAGKISVAVITSRDIVPPNSVDWKTGLLLGD